MSKLVTLENIEALKVELGLKQPVNMDYFISTTYNDTEYFEIQNSHGDSIEIASIKDIFDLMPALNRRLIPVAVYDPDSDMYFDTIATVWININSNENGNFAEISLYLLSGNGDLYVNFSEPTISEEPQLEFSVDWSEVHLNSSGGISTNNFIGLTYNNSSEFYLITADGRTFETVEDYANFLDPFNEKQFLVRVMPEAAAAPDKYSTDTAIILTDWDKDGYHISLETAHGVIDITITQEDVEVSDAYPTGIKLTYDIDWSKAVDWSSTSGGSSGPEIIDAQPFYNLFMAILNQASYVGFELRNNKYYFSVDQNDEGGYIVSTNDELYTLFETLYQAARQSIDNDNSKPAEIDFNKKVLAITPTMYGYELSNPVILDNFAIGQYYNAYYSRYGFNNYITCHIHFLSDIVDQNEGRGIDGIVDGILTYSHSMQEEGPDYIQFCLNTKIGACSLNYEPAEL